jgi:hypothetical protein
MRDAGALCRTPHFTAALLGGDARYGLADQSPLAERNNNDEHGKNG